MEVVGGVVHVSLGEYDCTAGVVKGCDGSSQIPPYMMVSGSQDAHYVTVIYKGALFIMLKASVTDNNPHREAFNET